MHMTRPLCYKTTVSSEKKEFPLTMKLTENVRRRIENIGEQEDRPNGYVARELMLRGLALYEEDGMLRHQEDINGQTLAPRADHKLKLGGTNKGKNRRVA
jgi:hypothetical protein